jgi:hypothetical protein
VAVLRIFPRRSAIVVERPHAANLGRLHPRFLSFDLCQQIRAVLTSARLRVPDISGDEPGGGSASGWTAPPAWRSIVGEGEIRWWTFAGSNNTLKHALGPRAAWKIGAFRLTIAAMT